MFFARRKAPKNPEPPPVSGRDPKPRGLFAGVPVVLVLVTGLILLTLLVLNNRFMTAVNACRAAQYPGATVINEDQPYFLQPFGSLATELHSPDAPDVVTSWYNQTYAAQMRAAIESGELQETGFINWQVTPADDGGSRIFLLCP